jgi:hypothetical protein
MDKPKDQLAWSNTANPPQQRFTETGARNTDPNRTDGLYVPPPPKRKPRVARAKVSTASKGSIPVTLGGRPPPVSMFGL